MSRRILLRHTPLGSFEWIDLSFGRRRCGDDMGGQIAFALLPFNRGLRAGDTIDARFNLNGAVAPFACLDYLVTMTAVIAAALRCHEGAFVAFSDRLTNHGSTPLSILQSLG